MDNTILVVDDAQADLDLLEAILDGDGYRISKAQDGSMGLQRAKQTFPRLVVSDVLMPGMNGLEFFKELRRDKATSHIPVMIMSARSKMEDSFLALGVDSFIAKPFNVDLFLTQVKKLISGPATQSPQETERPFERKSAGHRKKALIFGMDQEALSEMRRQLESRGCLAVVVDENQLVPLAEEMKPDVVFLAVNASTIVPMETLIYTLTALAPIKKGSSKMRVVLFKMEEELGGIQDTESDLADFENLLQRCFENGAAKYLGHYSSSTFLQKTREFL